MADYKNDDDDDDGRSVMPNFSPSFLLCLSVCLCAHNLCSYSCICLCLACSHLVLCMAVLGVSKS